jgi:hypothetical protein
VCEPERDRTTNNQENAFMEPEFFDFDDLSNLVGVDGDVVKAQKEKKISTWADYVIDYAKLPQVCVQDLWLMGEIKSCPTVHGWHNEKARGLFENLKISYQNTAYHLAYNLLTKDEFENTLKVDYKTAEFQLFHTSLIAFKESADDELETIKLIRNYRPKSLWAQSFDSVEQMWFRIAMSECWHVIDRKNILGNGKPLDMGKTEFIRKGRKTDKLFKTNTITASAEGALNVRWEQHFKTLFIYDAAKIAADDDYFCENYWKYWWERQEQFWDEMETDENKQLSWITIGGELFITGNGRRLPKTDTGFAKKPGEVPKRSRVKNC